MKYLIYLRVSTDKQDTETQRRIALESLNRLHPDGNYKHVVFDEGDLSSQVKYLKRPQLQKMLQAVSAGDIVVVYMLDRLSRDTIEMVTAHREITRKGATVLSLTGEHTDEFTITIMGAIAQKNRELIQLKTKDKLQTKKKNGERYSRFLPHGYAMHETKLVPIRVGNDVIMKRGILVPLHEEQQSLQMMQDLRARGLSYQQIADSLDDAGYKNREGKPFQRMTVYRILRRTSNSTPTNQLQPAELSRSSLQ